MRPMFEIEDRNLLCDALTFLEREGFDFTLRRRREKGHELVTGLAADYLAERWSHEDSETASSIIRTTSVHDFDDLIGRWVDRKRSDYLPYPPGRWVGVGSRVDVAIAYSSVYGQSSLRVSGLVTSIGRDGVIAIEPTGAYPAELLLSRRLPEIDVSSPLIPSIEVSMEHWRGIGTPVPPIEDVVGTSPSPSQLRVPSGDCAFDDPCEVCRGVRDVEDLEEE